MENQSIIHKPHNRVFIDTMPNLIAHGTCAHAVDVTSVTHKGVKIEGDIESVDLRRGIITYWGQGLVKMTLEAGEAEDVRVYLNHRGVNYMASGWAVYVINDDGSMTLVRISTAIFRDE